MIPLAGPRAPELAASVEPQHLLGLYLTAGYGALSGSNQTPRTVASPANSITFSNLDGANAADFGLGLRYYPVRWLMLDGSYQLSSLSAKVDEVSGDGNTNTGLKALTSSALAASANYVYRAASWLRLFGGVGGQLFIARIDPDKAPLDRGGAISLATEGGSGNRNGGFSFARPFVRLGVEWSPQDRIGIGVFGILYPMPYEADIYLNDVQSSAGTADPVLKYSLPTVTANGSLAFYF